MTDRRSIAYQGEPGANSHIACVERYPEMIPLPCPTFEDAFAALQEGAHRPGVTVVRGEHHQGVATVVGEVGRNARVDVRHERLGLAPAGQIEDLRRQLHDLGVGDFTHRPDHLSQRRQRREPQQRPTSG